MLQVRQLLRLLYINYVLAKHGLDDIIFEIHLFRPFRFLIYLMPWNWIARNRAPRGQRIREALEDLGPIFIKFGQMLSTRKDLLPEDIAEELTALQDRVPPFDGDLAQQLIEKAYGTSIDEYFDEFNTTPLASASIAQVHTAKLKDGKEIVVKVLRPNIQPVIKRDIALLFIIAKLAERYSKDARRLRAIEIVQEYEKTILDELDLMREAANASQLRRNFENSKQLYIPEVYWDYTRRNVMVMERIHGEPMANIEKMKAAGVNMQRLSELGVEIFFTQVFSHNFFHADMHPGNLFVDMSDLGNPEYIAVDFGIVGTLSPKDQRYLAENFLAFFKRDYNRVAQLHVDSGWVPAGTRVDEFESAIRSVCEPIFEKPLKDISFGQLLLRLFQTARRFNMEVQPQLVLLQKTLLNIEGLGRQIYPDLDLWQTAKPFLEKWMNEQVGVKSLLKGFKKNLPYIAEKMPDMPELLFDAVKKIAEGENHQQQAEAFRELNKNIESNHKKLSYVLIGVSGLIMATILSGQTVNIEYQVLHVPVMSWLSAGIGSVFIWIGLKRF
ncbi:MAG: ubiquinone biosynthesis regulatory protein kinase UbiB [endosymbiont of Galathealinum brachiosum]|uniref:Probable protein kinase UbiB n=1 Tax=endosymbiont of Galathealinum brachiosum TaxID=2200906 RepID=A0A370DCH5_9GAMM|nr:MAG: ubiquinone biosynthesis regulatory protein kinase UbiB [endosymbiont of Galathealinum brachiosum]